MTIIPEPRQPLQLHEMSHPIMCDGPWCLVEPIIQRDGQVSHWAGAHRGGVDVLAIEHGTLVEVAIAREEDLPGRFGEPVVHVLMRETQGSSEQFELKMTPAEARRLAKELTDFAGFIEQHPENVYQPGEIADRLLAGLGDEAQA